MPPPNPLLTEDEVLTQVVLERQDEPTEDWETEIGWDDPSDPDA